LGFHLVHRSIGGWQRGVCQVEFCKDALQLFYHRDAAQFALALATSIERHWARDSDRGADTL